MYDSIQYVYNRSTYRLDCRIEQSPDFRLESLNLLTFSKLRVIIRVYYYICCNFANKE